MVHVPFADALTHACLPELAAALARQTGNPNALSAALGLGAQGKPEVLDKMRISRGGGGDGAAAYDEFRQAISDLEKPDGDFPVALAAIAGMVATGVWIPLRLVLSRPFIEHEMFSAIMMVGGADTGNTLLGPADFQVAANTTVKTIEGCVCLFELRHMHILYTFQHRGTGSLPHTHSASATVAGILWIFKNNAGRRSVSLRGILPKTWRCKSAFSHC